MSVKHTKLSGGGEVGEIAKGRSVIGSNLEKFRKLTYVRKFITLFFVLLGCLLVVIIFAFSYGKFVSVKNKSQVDNSKVDYVRDFLNSSDNSANKIQLVEKYGEQYEKLIDQTLKSNPANWDKAKLDDACAALLYADKMGAYTQVGMLLSFIEIAKQNGQDIDKNSYGVNKEIRDSIKSRAESIVQQHLMNSEKKDDKN